MTPSTRTFRRPCVRFSGHLLYRLKYIRQIHGFVEHTPDAAIDRLLGQIVSTVSRHEVDPGIRALGANFVEALNTILARYFHIKETGIAGDGAIGIYGILAASRDLDHVIIYGQ